MFKKLISSLSFWVFILGLSYSLNAQAFSFSQLFQNMFVHTGSNNSSGLNSESTRNYILAHTNGLNPKVLDLALNAYEKLHKEGYDEKQVLTIVDYTKPSTEARLWVVDLKNLAVPFHELVAHGKNSGADFSTQFSDNPRSLESSIGVYLTGDTYVGHHGYSLRLNGLESGFNDKARAREIVVHAANYVSEAFARIHGRLGRSWGCFAVNPSISGQLISDIKGGTVLFAYYPDERWLNHSAYLQRA